MTNSYLRLVGNRNIRQPLAASFIGALPIGMLSLAAFLLVQERAGSPASAGLVSGSVGLGNALGLLAQGRLLDRHPQTLILRACCLLCPLAVGLLLVLNHVAAPTQILGLVAGLSGAALPSTTTSLRLLWPELAPNTDERNSAYALSATAFQVALIAGPLLVTTTSRVGGPTAALLTASCLASIGGLIFSASKASQAYRPSRLVAPAGSMKVTTGMMTLWCSACTSGLAMGALLAVLAVSSRGYAGIMLAAFAVGELAAGIAYGARNIWMPVWSRIHVGYIGMAIGVTLLTAVGPSSPVAIAAMALTGVSAAPVVIGGSAILDDIAAPSSLGKAYTTLISVGLLGQALGTALAGAIIECLPLTMSLGLSILLFITSALIVLLRRASLTAAQEVVNQR